MRSVEKATSPAEGVEPVEWDETIDGKIEFQKKKIQSRCDLTVSLAIYLRMLEMNLVQASVDGFINVVLTRASWSRRRCFVEENEETVIGAFLSALVYKGLSY
jgi:hypothetical protein